jgi:hypothetical protein
MPNLLQPQQSKVKLPTTSTRKAPAVTQQVQPVQAAPGRPAKFECHYTGDAPLNVTWLRGSQVLQSGPDYQVMLMW